MKFEVISPIKSGGKYYGVGDQVDLTKAQADELQPGLVRPLADVPQKPEDPPKGEKGGK